MFSDVFSTACFAVDSLVTTRLQLPNYERGVWRSANRTVLAEVTTVHGSCEATGEASTSDPELHSTEPLLIYRASELNQTGRCYF